MTTLPPISNPDRVLSTGNTPGPQENPCNNRLITAGGGSITNDAEITPATSTSKVFFFNSDAFDGAHHSSNGSDWEEALLFGYNFVLQHTDVIMRKALKVWEKESSGSKKERVSRAFLVYRLSLRCGDRPAEIFSRCQGDDGFSSGEGWACKWLSF